MLQKYIYSYFSKLALICAICSLASCTETIELNTDKSAPVIVINGVITNELKHQEVRISSSSGYFENTKNPKISGAKVMITTDDKTYELKEVSPGVYRTIEQMSGVPGRTYNLQVEVDFNKDGQNEIYKASTNMEKSLKIDSLNISAQEITGYKFFSFDVSAQTPPNDAYYLCRYIINDSLYNSISKYNVFDNTSIKNQYLNNKSVGYFPNSADMSRYGDDDKKHMIFMNSKDRVTLQMCAITRGYFDFLFQSRKVMNGEDPFFGGPLSNVTTNISNGGVGYFTAYCIAEAKNVAP